MQSNYKRLGDYIEPCDLLNENEEITLLQGISNEKYFQRCKSNTNDIDLTRYRICREGWFCYNRATTRNGDRISIAYRDKEDCLVSPSYKCFKIKDEDILNPYYLLLWFKRPQFDRYARFKSHGSAHEYFEYEEMCEVQILIPPIDEQKRIVNAYNVIERRIELKRKINENLEELIYSVFKKLTVDDSKKSTLSDIAIITMGTSPEGETFNEKGEGLIFYQGRFDFGFRFPTVRLYTTDPKRLAKKGDILMSVRAPVGDINIANLDCAIGRGIASIRPKNKCYSLLYYIMKELHFELSRFNDDGTVFGSINKDDLFILNVPTIPYEEQLNFEKTAEPIDKIIADNEIEIHNLLGIQSLLLCELSV